MLTVLCVAYTGAYFLFYIVFRDAAEIAESDLLGYLEVVLLLSAGLGLSVGTIVGLVQLRALDHERERKQIEHLNRLRHEVLNSAQKIDGYAGLLCECVDDGPEAVEYLDIIARVTTTFRSSFSRSGTLWTSRTTSPTSSRSL